MRELKYICKVAETFPYKYENLPICKVELWDFSRANENNEARKEAVCLVASISYGNEFCKDPEKLWNLLIERGHESPFEFVRRADVRVAGYVEDFRNERISFSFDKNKWDIEENIQHIATFKLKVPIFVARQIQRHRSFSYMEMSRRYVKGDKVKFEFWFPPTETPPGWFYIPTYEYMVGEYGFMVSLHYKPEQARTILPLGLYTQFWMQGGYDAWLNFFIHRLHPEAQEETRLVAKAMWSMLKEHQPEIVQTMSDCLDNWTQDCNPIFTPARKKRAEWFKKEYLEE
jgi:thymidylate synthase ThyX